MSPIQYFGVVSDHFVLYALLLLLTSPLHYWLAKRLTFGIFDPLFMVILTDWFGLVIVSFMRIQNDISELHFFYYITSQVTLYAGLFTVSRSKNVHNESVLTLPPSLEKLIIFFSLLFHVTATGIKWALTGVPLFNVSRLGAFANSGGFGLIERIENGSFYILAFCTIFHFINSRIKSKKTNVLIMTWLLIYLSLSGSKGALLGIVQILFLIKFVFSSNNEKGSSEPSNTLIYFLVSGIFAFAVLAIQSQGDIIDALAGFAFRLVSFGDIYMYAYLNDTIHYITGDNPIIGLFGGMLSTFRIIPVDWIYPHMGLQFTGLIYPDLDYMAGPNPRHNVFFYHYFGWMGVVFSYIIGILIRFFQMRLYALKRRGYLSLLWAFLFYFAFISLSADFEYSLSLISSILVSVIPILLCAYIFYFSCFHLRGNPNG